MGINAQRSHRLQAAVPLVNNESLEQLVLQSGSRALQHLEYVFRKEINANDLRLVSGSNKQDSPGRGRQNILRQYRKYTSNISMLLRPHWHGSARRLKRYLRQLLKPFGASSVLLRRLLATPVRIIASGCLMVLLSGSHGEAAIELNHGQLRNIQSGSSPVIKQASQQREVFFIDPLLPDFETLVHAVPPEASVVLLEPAGDLIGQMLDHLLRTGPVSALHLFTHGAPGQLQLGSAVINTTTLYKQKRQLEILGTLLTRSRDIHLYGCRTAAGSEGKDFIRLLASLTNADVAASDDFTGAAGKGGDWDLELVTGTVDTRSVSAVDYSAVLGGTSGQVIAGDGSGGGGGGGSDVNGFGGDGGDGGGNDDILVGAFGPDVLFGDGSGGGGGGNLPGAYSAEGGAGGRGGSGNDTLSGGLGDDILLGDGFDGSDGSRDGGIGGFGGGGGGGGGDGYVVEDGNGNYYCNPGGKGGAGGIGGGGGGGGYLTVGGAGSYGGGAGGAGNLSDMSSGGGGGGGGGYANGKGGAGGEYEKDSSLSEAGVDGAVGSTSGGYGGYGGSKSGSSSCDGTGGGGGALGGDVDSGFGGKGINSDSNVALPGAPGNLAQIIIDDGLQIYNYVSTKLDTLASLPGGAGNDTLDGGPGSDHLFGMGGSNTFVFESDDADSGADVDIIYDWSNGTGNKIELKTGGKVIGEEQISAIVAAQQADGADRLIEHASGSNKVTIVVKDIGRNLKTSEFIGGASFPWTMFLPAIVTHK